MDSFLWARNNRLYKGIGGNRAIGSGRKPLPVPADVAVAMRERGCILIVLITVVEE
jgi:hypothetical protein